MNLAQALHRAGREEDAQYVADMRYRVSNQRGEYEPGDAQKMADDLKAMLDREEDPKIRSLYQRALRDIDAPTAEPPSLPDSTPPVLRQLMDDLNQIPVARMTGRFAGQTRDTSAVQDLAELIRKVDAGDGGSVGTVESELRRILRSFHESVDGSMAMWRLEGVTNGNREIAKWVRSFYPRNADPSGRARVRQAPLTFAPITVPEARTRLKVTPEMRAEAAPDPGRSDQELFDEMGQTPAGLYNGVLTGEVPAGTPIHSLLTEDTDMRGVPVKYLGISGVPYALRQGRAWRFNGVTFIAEFHPDRPDDSLEDVVTAAMDSHMALPPEVRQFQRGYVMVQHRDPYDGTVKGFVTSASARNGDIVYFRMSEKKRDARTRDVANYTSHESAHNADMGLGWYSAGPEWEAAGGPARKIYFWQPVDEVVRNHAIMFPDSPTDPDYTYPGVTTYGSANSIEDFAEAVRLYLAGMLGRGALSEGGRFHDLWFRDLFPARAALLDSLFPAFARQQLAEIEAARARGRRFALLAPAADVLAAHRRRSGRPRQTPLRLGQTLVTHRPGDR